MAESWKWHPTRLDVEERPDGSTLLRNRVELAGCPANIVTWLHEHAGARGDRPFLSERRGDGWRTLTFSETLASVNAISNALVDGRLDVDRPLAILSENCIEMALVSLAAMQIGQPIVPISFAYSALSETGGHIEHILAVTEPCALAMSDADLHMTKLDGMGAADGVHLFAFRNSSNHARVADFARLLGGPPALSAAAEARFRAVTEDTSAKIQFTSGSTDQPKGVIVTHGMMASNQAAIASLWPSVGPDEVLVDWLPWNHTFGGNFVFNLALRHGASMHIDNGNPTPAGLPRTIRNIIDVRPTIYFGVPRSFSALLAELRRNPELEAGLFANLKAIFTAAAALDGATYQGLREMSARSTGSPLPFLAGWGSTETSPCSTLVFYPSDDARGIGLPIPGVTIKLSPDPGGKRELRVRGPNVFPGYYRNPEATALAFDDEGFYRTGDAGAYSADTAASGLVFDGRIGEDFKLSSGAWVQNSKLRESINRRCQPLIMDVVVAAPDHDYLTAMLFPNLPALRARFPEASQTHRVDGDFLSSDEVVAHFTSAITDHNAGQPGSSRRFERFTLLDHPPDLDRNETTDKGYINQHAVLEARKTIVRDLYREPAPRRVHLLPTDE